MNLDFRNADRHIGSDTEGFYQDETTSIPRGLDSAKKTEEKEDPAFVEDGIVEILLGDKVLIYKASLADSVREALRDTTDIKIIALPVHDIEEDFMDCKRLVFLDPADYSSFFRSFTPLSGNEHEVALNSWLSSLESSNEEG